MKEDKQGWWSVPPLESWKCPECGETSPVEEWKENRPYCEECEDHDGRECPECGEIYDHVWGDKRLAEAQNNVKENTK